jgi:hypothetical protein
MLASPSGPSELCRLLTVGLPKPHSKFVTDYDLKLDRKAPQSDFRLFVFGRPEPEGIIWDR